MKRKLLAILAIILALVLSLTLASCGGSDDDDDDDDDDKSSSSSGKKDKNQVTETVWNKYTKLENVFSYEFEYTRDEQAEIDGSGSKGSNYSGIYSYFDGDYLFSKDDGTDNRGEHSPSQVLDLPFNTSMASLVSMCDFEFDYDKFEYDTKDKSYVYSDKVEMDEFDSIFDFTVTVKFENNELVIISVDCVVSVDTDLMKGTSTTFETFTFTSFDFSKSSNGDEVAASSVVSNSKNSSTYSSSANNSYNGNSSYFGSNSGGYPSDPAPSTNPYKVTESVWQGIMELDTYSYYSFDYESLTNINGGSPTKNTYTYSYHNNKYTYKGANNIQSSFYDPFSPVDLPHIALEQSILWLVSDSSQMLNYSNYSFDGTEYCYVFTTDSYVNIAVMVAFENNVLERITIVSSQDTSDGLVSKTETFTFYDWE